MRRCLPLLAVLAIVLLTAVPVIAGYSAPITITETSSNSYTMLPVATTANVDWMASNGFMDSDGQDTRVQTLGGLYRPHMLITDTIWTVTAVPADSQTNLYLSTGNSSDDMDIIVGLNGKIDTTDHADLELGNDFEVAVEDVYLDTSADGYMVYKVAAFGLLTLGGDVVAYISESATASHSDDSSDVARGWDTDDWEGQTFLTTTAGYLTQVIFLAGTSSSGDDSTVAIRATAAGLPTGPNLASQTFDCLTGSNTVDFDWPVYLADATTYAVIFYNTGSSGDRIVTDDTAPAYASGSRVVSTDTGASWAADTGEDARVFSVWTSIVEVSSTVAVGEHDVVVAADTTDMTLTIDSVEEDSMALSGASVPDNANNWVFMDNSVNEFMPYAGSIAIEVSSTDVLLYDPADIISGTTLPDREGTAQDGTITFGSNPGGVAASIGSLVSDDQTDTASGTTADPTRDLLPTSGGTSDWFTGDNTVTKASTLANPVRPLITAVSGNTALTEAQTWRWAGVALWIGMTLGVAKMLKGHQGITAMLSGTIVGGLVAFDSTLFPLWLLVMSIGLFLGGVVAERSPSV
jgi:hypothetical protein